MKQLPVEMNLVPRTQGNPRHQAATTPATGLAGEAAGERGKSPRSTSELSSRSTFSRKLKKEMEKMDRSEAAKTAQAAPDSRSGKLTGTGPANAAAGSEAAPEEVPGANSNASAGLLGGEEKTPAFAGGGKRIAAVPEKRNSGIEKSGPKGPAGDAATLPATGTEISAAIPEASPEKQILSSELPVPRKDPAAREKVTAPVPFVFAADRQAQRECPAAGPAPEGLDRSVSGHSARPETAAQSSAGQGFRDGRRTHSYRGPDGAAREGKLPGRFAQ